jgi:hypothetical protein
MNGSRRGRAALGAAALAVGLLVGINGASALAQSPAASPAASPAPSIDTTALQADCSKLAGLLPSTIGGAQLGWEAYVAEDVGPAQELLDKLGVKATDFCQISFRYGDDPLAQGVIWRFHGATTAGLTDAVLDYFTGSDTATQWARSDATVAGKPVRKIDGTRSEETRTLYVYALGDTLFLGQAGAPFESIIAALPAPGASMPDVTAPPTLAPTPAPS